MSSLMSADAAIASYVRNNSSLALLVLDADGTIHDANSYVRELTGRPCVGSNIREILVDFRSDFNLDSAIMAEDPVLVNIDTRQGLPQTIYFRFQLHDPWVLAFGEVNAPEVEELRKELLDSTISLSNLTRELHKKNAELVRLNDLKNHFLGMAAHDLRNPLGAIRMYTDFLLEVAIEDMQTDHVALLNDIRNLSEFMLRMINDLLDISVIESGKLRMDLWRNDLVDLVRHTMSINRVFAEKKQISLELSEAPDSCTFFYDGAKIKQVLNNLISNAIKFSHRGTEVRLKITVDKTHATVAVSDNGQGIPEDEMEMLFKPFAKLSVRGTAEERSTGLGLAICQKIVMAHRGKIWAESNAGVGSVFSFSLPVTVDHKEQL